MSHKQDQVNLFEAYQQIISENLDLNQLATISDTALDNAYHYGRSTPGNSFGWQANLKSAEFAKKIIDGGVADIEKISDAIHKGWNVTAKMFVENPDQFDDTEKLKANGKLEAKLAQRSKLMSIEYSQLPEDEKEKDRVVARALLQALQPNAIKESFLKESAEDIFSLLSTLRSQSQKNKITMILEDNPEWIEGLKKFKEEDPEGYRHSLSNFESNGVSSHLIQKMARGKSIGMYDFQ